MVDIFSISLLSDVTLYFLCLFWSGVTSLTSHLMITCHCVASILMTPTTDTAQYFSLIPLCRVLDMPLMTLLKRYISLQKCG